MNKRQKLIEEAFDLFYKKGIHSVGINQILKQANVAKKTLYSYFNSKEALLEAVLQYRDECFLVWMDSAMQSVKPGKPALLVMFDALDDWFHNRVPTLSRFNGCFFINTCSEYGDETSG
ncbi:TetR/AcrR family transcriptional regulator, partial [Methylophaga sp.]|uniref:TetR/AcrR family transcriptional regulator n=1 Tax=Methylophaga sp. TaxID=2024840 RepID=UPI003F69F161